MVTAETVTAGYQSRLTSLRGGIERRIRLLYGEWVTVDDIDAAFREFVPRAVEVTEAGQIAGAMLTTAYLDALLQLARKGPLEKPAHPFEAASPAAFAALGPVVKSEIGKGRRLEDAVAFGSALAVRTADGEVTRAVDAVTTAAQRRAVGWRGLVRSGSCGPCQANAGLHSFDEAMYRHPGCDCVRELVFGGAS